MPIWNRNLRLKQLQQDLDQAQSYQEWHSIASELDHLEGKDDWRAQDSSPHYHYRLIQDYLQRLQRHRQRQDIPALLSLLQDSLHATVSDVGEPALYQFARTGTKHLIEQFLQQTAETIVWLTDTETPLLPLAEKQRLLKLAMLNFGRTALMLSGGGIIGIFHLGLAKALLAQQLLPRVVSGSSMGSFIAGMICCRDDEELAALFADPQAHCDTDALRWLTAADFWAGKRSLLDQPTLERCIVNNIGEWTFEDSYHRTGRILNISVSPTRTRQLPRLLNYLTAPDLLVAYSSLASCAIPGLFPPVTLKARHQKKVVDHMASETWIDGSVHGDFPINRLSRLLNVNHFVASQVNPHVLPFISTRHRRGLAPFALDMLFSSLHAQGSVALGRARQRTGAYWPRMLDKLHALTDQNYLGDITIYPPQSLWLYTHFLKNPRPQDMQHLIQLGERCTWPKIAMIRDHTLIRRTLRNCYVKLNPELETNRALLF